MVFLARAGGTIDKDRYWINGRTQSVEHRAHDVIAIHQATGDTMSLLEARYLANPLGNADFFSNLRETSTRVPGRRLAEIRLEIGLHLRFIPIDTEAKRGAIERAQQVAVHRYSHLGRPGHSLKQTLNRFSYVMAKLGITRDKLEVTIHGLRHQYANDLYFTLTDIESPVRGGEPTDLKRHVAACLEISKQLGHGRPQVSQAYISNASSSRQRSEDHATRRGTEVANAISPAWTVMSPIVQVSTLAPGALVAQNLLDGIQV
jgi:hypothetical protein